MKIPYTIGPWEVGEYDRNGQAVIHAPLAGNIEIATCWHHCVRSIEREMKVNAKLISAAPLMYETLKKIAEYATGGVGVNAVTFVEMARKAIPELEECARCGGTGEVCYSSTSYGSCPECRERRSNKI